MSAVATMPSVRGKLTPNAPLAPLVWFKSGGSADWLFEPKDEDDLVAFLRDLDSEIPVMALGLGSNMTDEDRREFVRGNLKLIATAASELVRQGDGNATAVDIDVGQFTGNAAPPPTAADRRQGDRRKGSDRRKVDLGPPPSGERRRGGRDQRGS